MNKTKRVRALAYKAIQNKYILVLYILLLMNLFFKPPAVAQCSLYSNPGNNVESPPQLCAPHNFEWRVWYTVSGSPATVELEIFWGDDPTPEIIPAIDVGSNKYEALATHVYPRGGDDCNYSPTVYIRIDGLRCTSSNQSQNVTVWDIDDENGGQLLIDPEVYRICVGNDANVTFTDNTIFNCVPASGENDKINNPVRWIQWIYGTGNPANRLSNVEVDGGIQPYAFEGPVEVLPGPVENSGQNSYNVYVPTTTPADLGKEFEITLRNWNICNPYDADTTDGDYLNPITPGGDSTFISRTARIIVVEQSDPDFQTRKNDAYGAINSAFCIGEQIYFENLTGGIDDDGDGNIDSNLSWRWEIFDNETGTGTPLESNSRNPQHTFSSPGKKLIRLIANDNNTVNNCGGQLVRYVDILPTANAAIDVTDFQDNPLSPLCYDPANPQNFEIKFHDVSTDFNPASSTWKWIFYDKNGIKSDSTEGSGSQQHIDRIYTQPGVYMTELVASAAGVECESRDTALVFIYQKPSADFIADSVCEIDSTSFTSQASLAKSVNGDQIILYEWDFDYDGATFDVDYASNSPANFKHHLGPYGTYRVAHRVSTDQGSCSGITERDITVLPSPDVNFTADRTEGCSPLTVHLAMDTDLGSQPAQVDRYQWFIRNLRDNTLDSIMVNPAADSLEYTFTNNQTSFIDHEYEVWVEAEGNNGCNAVSAPQFIKVFSAPPSEFIVLNQSGLNTNCSPRTYDFRVATNTRDFYPDTYQWKIVNLEDSTTITDTLVVGTESFFSYTLENYSNQRKLFEVVLTAHKAGYCFTSTHQVVEVNPLPSGNYTYEVIDEDCDMVRYALTAEQAGLKYNWTVSPSPINDPDYTEERLELLYQKNSNNAYPVRISLVTTNIVGCQSHLTEEEIAVNPQEDIGLDFSLDPGITEIPNTTINIINNTNKGNWNYYWDWGDGTSTTEATPESHPYEEAGEYMVRVRAEGQYCYEEDSAIVIINQTLPQVDFSFTSIEGCLPLEVTFTNETHYADSSTFFWDFGDGNTSTEANPVHIYNKSGIYTISLQASNELGEVMEKQVDIIVDLDQGPKSEFRIRLAQAYLPGQEISFFNQSQRTEFYYWDFGDGNTSTAEEPTHVYDEVGAYDITLIASNSLGCADTLVRNIIIEPFHPEVDFTYEPPTGCRPLTVQFRNLTRFAEPGTYRWSFGEGEGVSTEENPSYTYYEPGQYTVTLEASNSMGITEQMVKEFSVEVYETPRAAFNLRPQEAFKTEPIYFVNLSIGADRYHWDFGDGNTSTELEPSHVYAETGMYDVTLIAESEQGCTDTLTMQSAVIIKDGGKANVPNAFTPNTSGPGGSDANGIGKNDVFLPVFEGVTSFHMMIFNRWGELLFESRDKNYGWDGYYKGKLCAMDVYVYKLKLEFTNGKSDSIVGDLSLIR
jgi:gliding motility-associated-like protein